MWYEGTIIIKNNKTVKNYMIWYECKCLYVALLNVKISASIAQTWWRTWKR